HPPGSTPFPYTTLFRSIGIPALAMLWWLLPSRPVASRKLDYFGFATLAVALGSLQLMLDRGQQKDWFDSWEIIVEGIMAASAFRSEEHTSELQSRENLV